MKTLSYSHRRFPVFALVLAAGWAAGATSLAQITTSGNIDGPEVWSGVIHLLGDVTVTANGSLTILPGTTVIAEARSDKVYGGLHTSRIELIAEGGVLDAMGTFESPIRFTTTLIDTGGPYRGDWYGIRVKGSQVTLKHCLVDFATVGLLVEEGAPIVEQCAFRRGIRGAHYLVSGSLQSCRLVDNQYGLATDQAGVVLDLRDCKISNNLSHGIHVAVSDGSAATNSLMLDRCEVAQNGGSGVFIDGAWGNVTARSAMINSNQYHGVQGTPHLLADLDFCQIHGNGGNGLLAQRTLLLLGTTNSVSFNGADGAGSSIFSPDVTQAVLPQIVRWQFFGNGGAGLSLSGVAQPIQVTECVFRQNLVGLQIASTTTVEGITRNDFLDNQEFEIRNGGPAAIIADANFWGEATTLELVNLTVNITRVYDSRDDGTVGQVAIPSWSSIRNVEPVGRIISWQTPRRVLDPGERTTLRVLAQGTLPMSYQWRINGQNFPGATSPAFVLPSATRDWGGSYSVVVANEVGTAVSPPSDVLVIEPDAPRVPEQAFFQEATRLEAPSGKLLGSNRSGPAEPTAEPGEPLHADKPGGASVWFTWRSPANGIATFRTVGATFDTLLGVYMGKQVSELIRVTADEDGGTYYGSQVRFNALTGMDYHVAVDGFAGARGDFVLVWDLAPSIYPLPTIVEQPLSQTVKPGTPVLFAVSAVGERLLYQWSFNGKPIPNATNPTLSLANVRPEQAGVYAVTVTGAGGLTVRSDRASLQLSTAPGALAEDKLEDLIPGGARPLGKSGVGGLRRHDFIPVSAGTLGTQIFANFESSTQSGEPGHGGMIGGSSQWLGLQATETGVVVIDTIGSSIDTVMAVYTGTNILTLQLVAEDDNGAPDGIRSLVRFGNSASNNYLVAVDGTVGQQGTLTVNWQLGSPPAISNVSAPTWVFEGQPMALQVAVSNPTVDLTCQWRRGSQTVAGATNALFQKAAASAADAGTYSVVLSNVFGMTTNLVGTVAVFPPISLLGTADFPGGILQFRVVGTTGPTMVLEASTNLVEWSPVFTNDVPSTPIDFIDLQAPVLPRRYYRAQPWP